MPEQRKDGAPAIPLATLHEAIASAYGNRHPSSRQWERDEMASASIARAQARITDWPESPYRLFVSDGRTILVRFWQSGLVEVCVRDHPDAIWGPPVRLKEEDA